jgi:predicted transcriptional regulator
MSSIHRDAILPMTDNYMQNIVRQEKNYEFRRYRISASVQRIWFYLNAPFSHIAYICEIDPARTRNPGDPPLPEDGIGNAEFNTEHGGEWERYDYAYRIRSVWKIKEPISLKEMKEKYDLKGAPRGLVYVPELLGSEVVWDQQECVWGRAKTELVSPAPETVISVDDGETAPRGTK